ncbi:MAG: septation protein IspZ [Methylocella sp.]
MQPVRAQQSFGSGSYVGFGVALIGGLAMNKPVLPIIFDNAMSSTERGWRLLTLRWGGFFFALALLKEIV